MLGVCTRMKCRERFKPNKVVRGAHVHEVLTVIAID
jgi:hypothetical protein